MGKTMCYKILSDHLLEGNLRAGETITIKIDQTLTQDATGTMAYLQFEAMGLDKVKNELAVSYVDHNTVQVGFENFDDHEYLRTVANNKGVVFSRAGNGICHQVHLERFALPGKTLVGSDSHTPTAGGVGSFAMGAGGLDVALAMAGVGYTMVAPKVVNIVLKGKLRPFVSAKDIILSVLSHFGVNGNVNKVFEYTGEGVKTLSVPERATITNMGAECVALLLQSLDKGDHILDVVCSLTYHLRSFNVQRLLVSKESISIELGYIPYALSCLTASLSKLVLSIISVSCKVTNIGDVHYMLYTISCFLKSLVKDIFKDECSEVSDMRIVVDCRSATVHTDLSFFNRYEILHLAVHCVIQLHAKYLLPVINTVLAIIDNFPIS